MSKEIEDAVYKMMYVHAGTVVKHLTNMYDTLNICNYCTNENSKKDNFCTNCGNPLNEVAKQHFPEMVKREK